MAIQRVSSHTVSRLTVHIVWSTKYRYSVLMGDIQKRCRKLLIQICDSEDIVILKGVVSKDHIHMHIEYRPSQNISTIVKKVKRKNVKKNTRRISRIKNEVLGSPFLGNRIWVLEYR